jgi:Flp pilus assembly protein TadG
MVEFALVLPIFMLILSGILDFGFMLYSRMSVINAAREGARSAVMIQAPTSGVIESTAKDSAVSAASQGGISVDRGHVTVTCLQTSASPSSTTTISCDSAVSGDSVKVKIDYPYHTFFPLLFGTAFNLDSTVQMVIEY